MGTNYDELDILEQQRKLQQQQAQENAKNNPMQTYVDPTQKWIDHNTVSGWDKFTQGLSDFNRNALKAVTWGSPVIKNDVWGNWGFKDLQGKNDATENQRQEALLSEDMKDVIKQSVLDKLGIDSEDEYAIAKNKSAIQKEYSDAINTMREYSDESSNDQGMRDALNQDSFRAYSELLADKNGLNLSNALSNKQGVDTSMPQNLVDLMRGKSSLDIAEQGIQDLQRMGQAFMQGQVAQANQDIYAKRQQMLEAQRKYGITGAVANAQAQDFELKAQQQLAQVTNQASLQWYQQAGAQMTQYREMEAKQQQATSLGILRKFAQGGAGSPHAEEVYRTIHSFDPSISFAELKSMQGSSPEAQAKRQRLLEESGALQGSTEKV